MTPGENAPSAAALRAEHDALAERLSARRSIDVLRRALYLLFFGLLSVGMAVKLAWDRWGTLKPGLVRKALPGRPLFFLVALAVSLVLLSLAIRGLLRARALMRDEDALFARFRALRGRLGLEP